MSTDPSALRVIPLPQTTATLDRTCILKCFYWLFFLSWLIGSGVREETEALGGNPCWHGEEHGDSTLKEARRSAEVRLWKWRQTTKKTQLRLLGCIQQHRDTGEPHQLISEGFLWQHDKVWRQVSMRFWLLFASVSMLKCSSLIYDWCKHTCQSIHIPISLS